MATIAYPFLPGTTVKLKVAVGPWDIGTQAYLIGYENVVDTTDLQALVRVADSVHGNTDLRVTAATHIEAM